MFELLSKYRKPFFTFLVLSYIAKCKRLNIISWAMVAIREYSREIASGRMLARVGGSAAKEWELYVHLQAGFM